MASSASAVMASMACMACAVLTSWLRSPRRFRGLRPSWPRGRRGCLPPVRRWPRWLRPPWLRLPGPRPPRLRQSWPALYGLRQPELERDVLRGGVPRRTGLRRTGRRQCAQEGGLQVREAERGDRFRFRPGPVGWVAPSGAMAPAVALPAMPAAATLAPADPPSAPELVSGSEPASASELVSGVWTALSCGLGVGAGLGSPRGARSRRQCRVPPQPRREPRRRLHPQLRRPARHGLGVPWPRAEPWPTGDDHRRPPSCTLAVSASLGSGTRPRRRSARRAARTGGWRFPGLRFRDGRLTRLCRDGDRLQEPRQALWGRLLYGRAVVQPDRQDDRLGVGEDVGPLVTGRPEHGTARPLPHGCCRTAGVAACRTSAAP